jgi:hypothetical protein
MPLATTTVFGTHRGQASGRDLFYGDTVVRVEKHSLVGVVFDAQGLEEIEEHLRRFGPTEPEDEGMLERIRNIVAGTLNATAYDARFVSHERRERLRYVTRAWPTGVPEDADARHRLWNTEHTCTLEEYGVHEKRFPLYHPDAVETMNDF